MIAAISETTPADLFNEQSLSHDQGPGRRFSLRGSSPMGYRGGSWRGRILGSKDDAL
jgi:hypothetical protein